MDFWRHVAKRSVIHCLNLSENDALRSSTEGHLRRLFLPYCEIEGRSQDVQTAPAYADEARSVAMIGIVEDMRTIYE